MNHCVGWLNNFTITEISNAHKANNNNHTCTTTAAKINTCTKTAAKIYFGETLIY